MTPDLAGPVKEAVSALRSGGVVALPTDTLYALSCDARDDAAVARVYRIKGREDGKPMPIFISDLAAAEEIGEFNELSRDLGRKFWPGQLTLVVKRAASFRSQALAGGDTVALRSPDHPVALQVLAEAHAPLTGTSANRSGGPDPVSPAQVVEAIGGEIDVLVDAGPCRVGVSSTVVDCTGAEPRILRQGAIAEDAIRQVIAASAGSAR